jgi:hypothetical protein
MITLPYTEAYIHHSSEITFYYLLYYTYCRATSLSVIDYLISIIDLFNYVDKFIISNFNEYSDHASLHVEFLVRNHIIPI